MIIMFISSTKQGNMVFQFPVSDRFDCWQKRNEQSLTPKVLRQLSLPRDQTLCSLQPFILVRSLYYTITGHDQED